MNSTIIYNVGDTNEAGDTLIFDKWAEQPGKRLMAWRTIHRDVRFEIWDIKTNTAVTTVSLAAYRADDLAKALQ